MNHPTLRRSITALTAAVGLTALAACSSVTYTPTAVPSTSTTPPASAAPASPATCKNATQTYDPLASVPSSASISDTKMRQIISRGSLIVGVSADTYLLGARNPLNGDIEGFDIDIANAVAASIFGEAADHVTVRVITAADRIPVLENESVDMVVRNMSMTCSRWDDIAFSAEYYRSGQKLLVTKPTDRKSVSTGLKDLNGERVCAPTGTSSLDKLREYENVKVVTAPNHTGCLVLFQQGQADAITGDDTVLAGLAAQDPYTVVTTAPAVTVEPYGIGLHKDDRYFARYVNAVLAEMKANGQWKAIYDKWLAAPLGPAPAPPTAVYGRR